MRTKRQIKSGAFYHVTARTNRGEMIFDSRQIKALFLATLKKAKKKFKFQIKNFCIMNNHFHLLIKPGKGASLSQIMQWLLSVFAMSYNRRLQLTGHVWGERFFSRIIRNIADFVKTFNYIDKNPVMANLVSNSREWKYGGLWHHKRALPGIVDKLEKGFTALFPNHKKDITK